MTIAVTRTGLRRIAPTPNQPGVAPTEAVMAMTTCHPMFSARERLIVRSTLDHCLPASGGTPLELAGGA